MKVIYVAGPMRAPSGWERELNIRNAEAIALYIWNHGAAVICPHAMGRFYDEKPHYIGGDIEIMKRCDAVYMIPGWEDSKGATEEHSAAMKDGMLIFYSFADLIKWLKSEGQGPGPA